MTASPSRPRFPLSVAIRLAEAIVRELAPHCAKIEVAGSVRRRKPDVGDVEVVYSPLAATERDPEDLFEGTRTFLPAERIIAGWIGSGRLVPRKSVDGKETVGPKNKLLVSPRQGIPVDLFSIGVEDFENYLVCRTGPASSNVAICKAARELGYRWNPYGGGFIHAATGRLRRCRTEAEVFGLVGLPHLPPEDRG